MQMLGSEKISMQILYALHYSILPMVIHFWYTVNPPQKKKKHISILTHPTPGRMNWLTGDEIKNRKNRAKRWKASPSFIFPEGKQSNSWKKETQYL